VLDASVGGGRVSGALRSEVGVGTGWRRLLTPSDAFVLDEAEVDGVLRVERTGAGPAVVLCLDGAVRVRASDGSGADLGPGGAVLLSRGLDPVEVRGEGSWCTCVRACVRACAGRQGADRTSGRSVAEAV
jgi:hypothetical protein